MTKGVLSGRKEESSKKSICQAQREKER